MRISAEFSFLYLTDGKLLLFAKKPKLAPPCKTPMDAWHAYAFASPDKNGRHMCLKAWQAA